MVALSEITYRKKSTNAYIRLLKEIGGYESWQADHKIQQLLLRRLSQFSDKHEASPQHLDRVMHGLSRGNSLSKAVRKWETPVVGAEPTSYNSSSLIRGVQWRLVLAYNAFEIVYISLSMPRRTNFRQSVDAFLSSISLEPYSPVISPPSKERATLQRWLEQSIELFNDECEDEGGELLDFLGLRSGDRRVFKRWIVEGQPIDSWATSIETAKALRNMTAHGSLSATKVRELGLQPAVEALTENLVTITCGAFSTLSELQ